VYLKGISKYVFAAIFTLNAVREAAVPNLTYRLAVVLSLKIEAPSLVVEAVRIVTAAAATFVLVKAPIDDGAAYWIAYNGFASVDVTLTGPDTPMTPVTYSGRANVDVTHNGAELLTISGALEVTYRGVEELTNTGRAAVDVTNCAPAIDDENGFNVPK
jgi:hypothetical protein